MIKVVIRFTVNIYRWDITKFKYITTGYWDNITNQRLFMDDLTKKLNISNMEDWYMINKKTLQHHGADHILEKYEGSRNKLLKSVYPEYHNPKCMIKSINSSLIHIFLGFQ